jgi:hypothetical protein
MKLLIASKEFRIARATAIDAFTLSIGVLPRERALGAAMSKHFEGQGVELVLQDRVIELDLEWFAIGSNGGKRCLAIAHGFARSISSLASVKG